jgi:hypothetical protein
MSIQSALRTGLAIVATAALVNLSPMFASSAHAQQQQQPQQVQQQTGVAKDAIEALARMSKTLQGNQFSFTSRTFRAYAGPNGELLHIAHTIKTIFRRPDRLSVSVTGDDGSSKMLFDGKNLVIYAVEQKKYAVTPVTGDIDKALDVAEELTGADFPLADLLSNDPGQSLLAWVTSGGQVGTATIDGVLTRHFFFTQATEDLEWELWLEDNDRALPRRVVVTYRSLPGRPNFIADLSDWNFSIQPPDSEFEFTPPAGVTRVELAQKANTPSAPPK